MPVPARILELTDRFDYNLESYKKGAYNETQVRLEYINPLMEELGWDVTNKQGYSEAYKDVIHEDAVKVGGVTKAPDYCFRIGGTRKFFLEAKKPSVNIREDTHPSYQLRRYAWSAKLPLSILTDFEEFAVYDCRVKPFKTDKASNARVMYLKFTDYKDTWDEIAGIFSHDAILKGSFDKYVESKRKKKGTAEVDTAFLEEIERWRELLARNIALRNPNLSQREVNFSVQRTIDRIIFLRICEDRGVENYGRLMALQNGDRVYKRLFQLFREADARYNSGLFYFRPEKGRPNDIDALTPDLTVDDKVLKDIVKNLYYPDSPYEFSVLPADILGQVYEQFLGKVIRLTPAHRAVIEFKPEVRKAGGVYYTPTYIVDYIVRETVGKLVEGKKPGPRGGVSKLKILDPACGSGSFLLGAYQYLLDWHRDKYVKDDPVKWARGKNPRLYQKSGDDWRLTTDERKRILLNNICGVDIDHQAVEVTKLSLLLKVLEGEDEETIQRQLSLFQQRALPDLGNNIKCGNSLIGSDFYDGQLNLFDDEEMYRINAFDWEDEFPDIMKDGGFDAVIGNPPWGAYFKDEELEYLRHKNKHIIVRMIDSYMYFINHSAKLLNNKGIFGMIIPSTLLTQSDMELLRKHLIDNFNLQVLINLGTKVFGPKVLNTSTIVTFQRSNHNKELIVGDLRNLSPEDKPKELANIKPIEIISWLNAVKGDPRLTYFTLNLLEVDIFQKLIQEHISFDDIIDGKIQRGISPDYADAFIVTEDMAKAAKIEKEVLRPVVLGKHISRYLPVKSSDMIIYLTRQDDINKYPYAKLHLTNFRDKITCREVAEGKHPWYSLHRPRDPKIFASPKFIGLTTTRSICIAFDQKDNYHATDALYLFGIKPDVKLDSKYVLGVLHSKLFQFLYWISIQGEQRVIPQIKASKLYGLPFPLLHLSDSEQKASHDDFVSLVEKMLYLHLKQESLCMPQEKTAIARQINLTERQINREVYKLYGLNSHEIEIVEACDLPSQ